MHRLNLQVWITFLSIFCYVSTGRAEAGSPDNVIVEWNSALLQTIRLVKPGPTLVARHLAILNTCIFDAWAAYDADAVGTRWGGGLRRPLAERTLANKNKAVSYAAYRAAIDLFPAEQSRFKDLLQTLGYDSSDESLDIMQPAGIGNLACRAVLEFRHRDGSNQLGDLNPVPYSDYTGYKPVNDPDKVNDVARWQPLRIPDGKGGYSVQQFLTPHWGSVVPFSLTSGAQFRTVGKPATATEAGFASQVGEMLFYSAHLTDRQKMIAEYWADGPASELPPGHWALFAQFVARRDKQSVDQSAKMFFALSNALLDVSIAVWDAKRFYDSVRPVTAIRESMKGQKVMAWSIDGGSQEIWGEGWQPYQPVNVVTPAFPEYPSGHSAFSAAGAEILKSFTGSSIFGASVSFPAGSSSFGPGVPSSEVLLFWPTFAEAADEAALSRRFGGIHFIDGDLFSRQIGKAIGAQVWAKAVTHFNGTSQ